ncbi:hypothetical protein MOO46_02765 [Apilactobacillus apisilvae]|uniref:Uncharacterized protein n=1 Tax=Apilactobacillus apisilvae TaxID=2923364 RepID=A0ABY4PIP4_9LACO|nr:hypothetical protein [Apilactobacillus apisilvae]UQS85525.1 hypothetical protein MOO46_02765 [Apilactobacillus apisilvae]
MLIFEMILAFVAAVIIYNLVHHFFITKPIDKGNKITMEVLDEFVKYLNQKNENKLYVIEKNNNAKIWGRNIYDYEYVINYDKTFDKANIQSYIQNEIKIFNNKSNFNHDIVMTDFFFRNDVMHIDFAYLLNSSTYEYVLDMKKLNK